MKEMNFEAWKKYIDFNAHLPVEITPPDMQPKIDVHLSKIPTECDFILDLGAGDGYAAGELLKKNKQVVAVSINPKEVDYMKHNGINAVIEDMHILSFTDNYFDCVYMRQVFEHSLAPFVVLSEISRVLKPKGYLMLIVPPEIDICLSNSTSVYLHNSASKHYSVLTEIQLKTLWEKVGFILRNKWVLITPHGTDVAYLLRKEN